MSPEQPSTSLIWARFDRMEDTMADQHSRLRSDMNANFDKLREEFKRDNVAQNFRLGEIEKDITAIKTERRMDEQRAGRNIALYSMLSGLGVTFLIKVFEFLLHK